MIGHSPRRSNLCSSTLRFVTQWWIQILTATGSDSGPLAAWTAQWYSSPLPQAGSLNDSPRASTAQAMRAFFAAMATTAFQ